MLNFLDRRKKRKLYQQWVTTSSLPQEEIPAELLQPESFAEETGVVNENLQNTRYVDRSYLPVRLRYILYIGAIIVLLVVLTSVLATVLVMKSC